MKKRITRRALRHAKPEQVVEQAEIYMESYSFFRSDLQGITGLVAPERLRVQTRKIDALTRELFRLEEKIDKVMVKRATETVKLDQMLEQNLEKLQDELEPESFREFRGR